MNRYISEMENIVIDFFCMMYDGYNIEKGINETFEEYISLPYKCIIPQIKNKGKKHFKEFNKYYKKYLKEFICTKGNLTPYRIWFFNTKETILNNKIQLVDTNKPRIYY